MVTQDDRQDDLVMTSFRIPRRQLAELERFAPAYPCGRSSLMRIAVDLLLTRLQASEQDPTY